MIFSDIWHADHNLIEGATSKVDGLRNTKAMAAAGSPIAQRVTEINLHGLSDFYIPSPQEHDVIDAAMRAAGSEPGTNSRYWTSMQTAQGAAAFHDYQTGGQGFENIREPMNVLPIRRELVS
ncbi:hypothetical protein [Undibacterium terreum]|uniref:DUF1566 domain-containing protein n=1 Tax=Undibacterium terreum TaxID=1224302 RepID=A0A916XSB2_9BURK|nr:hypothetical protein [Undibacterium terreum]GGD00106.1 hypothetical protein GCM10011396_54520 [Undibacterium terreum]